MTNFIARPIGPIGQRQYNLLPRVELFQESTPLQLQLSINDFIAVLAAAPTDDKYNIVAIEYQTKPTPNGDHTALLRYNVWMPE